MIIPKEFVQYAKQYLETTTPESDKLRAIMEYNSKNTNLTLVYLKANEEREMGYFREFLIKKIPVEVPLMIKQLSDIQMMQVQCPMAEELTHFFRANGSRLNSVTKSIRADTPVNQFTKA